MVLCLRLHFSFLIVCLECEDSHADDADQTRTVIKLQSRGVCSSFLQVLLYVQVVGSLLDLVFSGAFQASLSLFLMVARESST